MTFDTKADVTNTYLELALGQNLPAPGENRHVCGVELVGLWDGGLYVIDARGPQRVPRDAWAVKKAIRASANFIPPTPVNRGPECMLCKLLGATCNTCNGTWAANVAAEEAAEAARPPEPTARELYLRRIERLNNRHRLDLPAVLSALQEALDEAIDNDADDLTGEIEAIIAAAKRHT